MSTQQILIRLPEDVAARFKAAVPARQRNKFVADLVARAVARQEDELTRIAVAVTDEERCNPELAQEMRDWEATIGDGMEEPSTNAKPQAR
ncbi:MAG: hypothetical protein ACTS6J_20145 [Burkholderiales bacterium]